MKPLLEGRSRKGASDDVVGATAGLFFPRTCHAMLFGSGPVGSSNLLFFLNGL